MKGLVAIFKIFLFFAMVFGAIVGVLWYAFWIRAVMPHNGMAPTLFEGDEILIWKGTENIRRGEIVVCEHPNFPGTMVVSRVIAMEGDTLDQDRHSIRLNGKSITSRSDIKGRVMFSPNGDQPREHVWAERDFFGRQHMFFRSDVKTPDVQQEKIKPGFIYVMNDNMPDYQTDSRKFGLVSTDACLGEVFMRFRRGNTPPEDIPYGDLDILE